MEFCLFLTVHSWDKQKTLTRQQGERGTVGTKVHYSQNQTEKLWLYCMVCILDHYRDGCIHSYTIHTIHSVFCALYGLSKVTPTLLSWSHLGDFKVSEILLSCIMGSGRIHHFWSLTYSIRGTSSRGLCCFDFLKSLSHESLNCMEVQQHPASSPHAPQSYTDRWIGINQSLQKSDVVLSIISDCAFSLYFPTRVMLVTITFFYDQ